MDKMEEDATWHIFQAEEEPVERIPLPVIASTIKMEAEMAGVGRQQYLDNLYATSIQNGLWAIADIARMFGADPSCCGFAPQWQYPSNDFFGNPVIIDAPVTTSEFQQRFPDRDNTCAICMEPFTDNDNFRAFTCTHGFHLACIEHWMNDGHRNCPMCRQSMMDLPTERRVTRSRSRRANRRVG